MLSKNFIPRKPFEEFKWKWASLQCTEGLNDPVVLLGVLFRMRKLEPLGLKYSSDRFAQELAELSEDVSDTIGVKLASRTGERNLIRNSGQYWKALKLINPTSHSGKISLTEFGREVADRKISQAEFAAITVQTFKLPNRLIQSAVESQKWAEHGITLYPLRLLLQIILELSYITTEELIKIIIPLSGCKADVEDYINFISWYRAGDVTLDGWPDCCPGANDMRIAREYLLFLSNYGYLNVIERSNRLEERYNLNEIIREEIKEIVALDPQDESLVTALTKMRSTNVISDVERKRVTYLINRARPNQANFRREVLAACGRCVITNVTMPEVLEAAHIKPFKYNGEDTTANGFAMRKDIHLLFDTGHLRISEEGVVKLSDRARMDYGALIPPQIVIPPFTNREFLRWRWENYDGI